MLVQVGCSVVMTHYIHSATHFQPLPRISLTFLSWLESLTVFQSALKAWLTLVFAETRRQQEDNDGITDTRKTSTTVWD